MSEEYDNNYTEDEEVLDSYNEDEEDEDILSAFDEEEERRESRLKRIKRKREDAPRDASKKKKKKKKATENKDAEPESKDEATESAESVETETSDEPEDPVESEESQDAASEDISKEEEISVQEKPKKKDQPTKKTNKPFALAGMTVGILAFAALVAFACKFLIPGKQSTPAPGTKEETAAPTPTMNISYVDEAMIEPFTYLLHGDNDGYELGAPADAKPHLFSFDSDGGYIGLFGDEPDDYGKYTVEVQDGRMVLTITCHGKSVQYGLDINDVGQLLLVGDDVTYVLYTAGSVR